MENKLLFKKDEADLQENSLAPLNLREREYQVLESQSKRLRITAHYLPVQKIERLVDKDGIFEGDLIEKVEVPEAEKGQQKLIKNYVKVKEGRGVQLLPNGDLYNGDWKDGKMQGIGSYFFSNENYFYRGDMREGEIIGRGLFFYSDSQDFYIGEVLNGKYHGKGLYYRKQQDQWELSDYKEGQLVKSLKTGEGRPQSLEISKELVQDDPQFAEIYVKPKDFFFEHYEGDYVDGKCEGNGIQYHKDGSRFEGSWKRGKPNGLGVTVHSDQKFDIGEFKQGLLHGFGRSQFHNGDIYRGYFYKGRLQGLGLYIYKESQQWAFCYFKNNNIGKEFERGNLTVHQKQPPNFGHLEKKFKNKIDQNELAQDIEFLESQIQVSIERKRKSLYGQNSESVPPSRVSPNKKKMVNLLIEETVTKKQVDQTSGYCLIV